MNKIFIFLCLCCIMVPAQTYALENNIVDNDLYEQVLKSSKTSKADIANYEKIFKAIKNNEIDEADKLVGKLKSKFLMGHVLAQKYLSRDYKTSYKELTEWSKKYGDLPQQGTLSILARTKAPGYKPSKPAPAKKRLFASYAWYKDNYSSLKPDDRKFVRQQLDEFLRAIRRTDNKKATAIMNDKRFRMTIPDKRYDGMSSTLAASYFYEGDYEQALKWTEKAVRRSHETTAAWFGGLAAWKLGDYKKSAELFEKLDSFNEEDQWLAASGAFWAHRANSKLKNDEKSKKYLKKAASFARTFYGILARYELGRDIDYDWKMQAYFNNMDNDEYRNEILKSEAIRRAILLIKAGQKDLAEADLRKNYIKLSSKQKELVMFISGQYDFANLSFVIANGLKNYSKDRSYDSFMYPYPGWQPEKKWTVNQSWIWALVRQESLFNYKVRSYAGACGLMQLMPYTAASVTKNKEYREGCKKLYDKKRNLQIGQDYVKILLDDENVGDNLFFLAASYNGGPHNVKKWVDRKNYENDPLLFVEMIPWRETRLYVKKVVANYWIYNSRRGKDSKSLKQLKKGEWPRLD